VKLPPEDVQFLIQFIENCESAGVLWRIGKHGDGNYRAVVLVGDKPVASEPRPKIHQAVKACVQAASEMGAASPLAKG